MLAPLNCPTCGTAPHHQPSDRAGAPTWCVRCDRTIPQQRAERIAALNDLARTAMGVCSRVLQTAGICALPAAVQSRIRERVELFDAFTPANDPHGERDFGNFEEAGERIFWKIDYYNRAQDGGSEDPADARQTVRVLTIMLAEEY